MKLYRVNEDLNNQEAVVVAKDRDEAQELAIIGWEAQGLAHGNISISRDFSFVKKSEWIGG